MTLENESKKIYVLKTVRDVQLVPSLGAERRVITVSADRTKGLLEEASTVAGRKRGTPCCKPGWGLARCFCVNRRARLIIEASAGI